MVADFERHHTQYPAEKIGRKVCADLDAGGLAAKGLHCPADVVVTGQVGGTYRAVPLIKYAMSIGNPSIGATLQEMKEQGCERILVFPLYPQYAASSTASAFDEVFAQVGRMRNVPALRTIKHYHDHPGYIASLAQNVRDHWMNAGRPDKLVMSFHGIPRSSLDKGDPYHCECQKTGRLLAEALELDASQYQICFQSRFGRAEWLRPYTAATLEQLGKEVLDV